MSPGRLIYVQDQIPPPAVLPPHACASLRKRVLSMYRRGAVYAHTSASQVKGQLNFHSSQLRK